MIIFFAYKVDDGMAYLDQDESRHCMKVLRKKIGGLVKFTDGKGLLYSGEVLNTGREVVLNNVKVLEIKKYAQRVIIAISPTKNLSRFEWFVEKGVEIGVTDVIPLVCNRTERDKIKYDRTERIIRSAAKQSLKYHHPKLYNSMDVNGVIELFKNDNIDRFIASFHQDNSHLLETTRRCNDVLILIGPEGDFTDEELEKVVNSGFEKVNISVSRLRTETAGLVACEILCLRNELNI